MNVLLSFAQFEREVIGERIRDKIAASKKKGMWMGGVPPLGYRGRDRKLVTVDSEAELVRSIFRRYAELGSVRLLKEELEAQGSKSKSWTSASGRVIGGKPFSRGALYLMLRNRTYRGEIVHKGQSHSGEHPPIIDQPLWDAVQMQLAGNTTEPTSGTRTQNHGPGKPLKPVEAQHSALGVLDAREHRAVERDAVAGECGVLWVGAGEIADQRKIVAGGDRLRQAFGAIRRDKTGPSSSPSHISRSWSRSASIVSGSRQDSQVSLPPPCEVTRMRTRGNCRAKAVRATSRSASFIPSRAMAMWPAFSIALISPRSSVARPNCSKRRRTASDTQVSGLFASGGGTAAKYRKPRVLPVLPPARQETVDVPRASEEPTAPEIPAKKLARLRTLVRYGMTVSQVAGLYRVSVEMIERILQKS